MLLSSDPHAWLRPYFAALSQQEAFTLLAPALRFSALCDAVASDHPTKAAQMREWSPAAQEATFRWLASITSQVGSVNEVELWTVTKPERELRCVVRYLPTGLDLRLMQGDDFRRTELHQDAAAVSAKATEWKTALLERGWQ
jgi:hypothetical protein